MNENENEKKKNSWLPIVGGIALIIVLFIVVKLIFAMLAQVVPCLLYTSPSPRDTR